MKKGVKIKKDVDDDEDDEGQKKQSALSVSIKEGSASSIATGVSAPYITPFALKLGANNFHIGLLNSLAGLVLPISEIFGSKLMIKHHRKKIVSVFVLIQALLWLPLGLLAYLSWKGIVSEYLVYLMILIYSLLTIAGGFAYPAWFSWMGDIIPEKERGKYFGRRNRITGITELVAMAIAAGILQYVEDKTYAILGFAVLFAIACIARLVSFSLFSKQYIPHLRDGEAYKISGWQIFKENKVFRKFALYQFWFNIAIMFASPFFAVYMLQELKFSYTIYIVISMSSTIFYLIFTPWIGRLSDKYGNAKLLALANIAFVFSPLAWVIIKEPVLLIIVPQLISGLANAALVIAFTNFSYSSMPGEQRGSGIAYMNLLIGLGTFVGSIAGGLALNYLPITFMNKYIFIFIVAAALRFIVAIVFVPTIKDDNKRKAPAYLCLAPRSFRSIHHNMDNAIRHIHLLEKRGLVHLRIWK